MRSRISRRLLHSLALLTVAAALAAWAPPAHGKGGFCPGLCGESYSLDASLDSVTYE
jgi:hypothetical protein